MYHIKYEEMFQNTDNATQNLSTNMLTLFMARTFRIYTDQIEHPIEIVFRDAHNIMFGFAL